MKKGPEGFNFNQLHSVFNGRVAGIIKISASAMEGFLNNLHLRITLFQKFINKIDNKNIWEGDLFDRKKEAIFLTNLLRSSKDGGVINIDAPWGYGKTYFLAKR